MGEQGTHHSITVKARYLSAILCLFFLMPLRVSEAADETPLITFLEIRGNKKIEDETIASRMKSSVGTPLSMDIVREDISSLYSLGYFDDIRVEVESFEGGVKLIFIFKEKPRISGIDFQGNREIETDKLKEKITLTPGAIANPPLIHDNARAVVNHYQSEGFWLAEVIPVMREISDDSVSLTFQVNEGPKVRIKEITIDGNRSIKTKEIRKVMKTKEHWFLSFLTGSGKYRQEEMKADIERINELYHSRGFIQVKVSEPDVSLDPDKKNLFLKITIEEGEQFRVGQISFRGNTVISGNELGEQLKTTGGEIFNRTAVKDDIDRMLERYTEKGYAMADINPLVDVRIEEKLVDITFSVSEGEIFRIGRINISGNVRTRDKVIRREMRLDEGEIYNSRLVRRSYQRIANLNFFDSVEMNPRLLVQEKEMDIDVKVKEKLTGMITVGGGYSSVDKFLLTGEITQTNLFGKGLYLRLKADLSSTRTNYYIKVTDPWFMDKPISATFSLYNESFEFPDYDKEATGGSVGFGKDLSEYIGGNLTYRLEKVKISDVDEDASSIIQDQLGKKVTSSISPSLWRDTRDSYLDPTRGSKNAVYTTFAGIGGDNYFIKTSLDSLWYFPYKWDSAFSLRGRIGYASGIAGKELPLYERFYVGGIDTVRGLGFGEGGPRDEKGEKIGGTKELIFNAEYIFPLEQNIRLKGVIFFDAGKSADSFDEVVSLRPAAGFGFRWMSPFGPIRLEWGYNISKRKDEGSSKVEFALGGVF